MTLHNERTVSRSLCIHLLGDFLLDVDDQPIDMRSMMRRRSAQLVKLLALQPGLSLRREAAIAALWPEASQASGSNRLRKSLHEARAALEPNLSAGGQSAFLRSRGQQLILTAPGNVWIDAAEFERLAADALAAPRGMSEDLCRAAIEIYRGDLSDDDRIEAWAGPVRNRLRGLFRSVLLVLADTLQLKGQQIKAIDALERALASDPLDEEIYRRLMRLFATTGERRRSLRQYERCREVIAAELDTEPEQETVELYEQIRSGALTLAPLTPRAQPPHPATNLPTPATSFVGREREIATVERLLGESRNVTLTGVGGMGKTRLAHVVAARLLDEYPRGVWLADLAPLADPELVAHTVASALGARLHPNRSVRVCLEEFISTGRLLLVLDNCERLVEAVAAFSAALLAVCPELRILATSREVLGVTGEAVLSVPPLDLAPRSASPKVVYGASSARLFVERARLSAPTYALGDTEAQSVAEICERLEGIPLAIELAAVRLMFLSVEQVRARLDDRFRLLAVESRTLDPRHRSLRAAIDWSYEMLDEPECILLRRLSIFVGGWTIEAAEDVCGGTQAAEVRERTSIVGRAEGAICARGEDLDDSTLHRRDVLDALGRLVARSLVAVDRSKGEPRYRLLDTVREYAAEKLKRSGEGPTTALAHSRWCLALAEEAYATRGGAIWTERLDREHDNIRAALAWAITDGKDADLGLGLTAAMGWYWHSKGDNSEGRRWLVAALGHPGHPHVRSRALYSLSPRRSPERFFSGARNRRRAAQAGPWARSTV